MLTCVTGVSGSGKSSLVVDTLLPVLKRRLGGARQPDASYDAIDGLDFVDKVIDIDQAPIGRTPRSNPATFTGIFTHIRDLYASLPDSKAHGYKAGRYSFNIKGGRCEACQGDGILRIEMHFLPDVYVECEACGGRRYSRETLEVKYRQASIADVLDMTVSQACGFCRTSPSYSRSSKPCARWGWAMSSWAGGNDPVGWRGTTDQALQGAGQTCDRTHGLRLRRTDDGAPLRRHRQLLQVLARLVDAGNTVIVIEHNLDVIKCADHVIDLGPEGGPGGGQIVAQGTPEEVAKVAASYTGQFLRKVL